MADIPVITNKRKIVDCDDGVKTSRKYKEDQDRTHVGVDDNQPPPIATIQYEYLDHTADVQLHAWGQTLEEALQQLVISLYGYMTTEMSTVEPVYSMDFEAEGHDLHSMVFNLLDTCLYSFCAEPFFIGSRAKVLKFTTAAEAKNLPDEEDCSSQCSIHIRAWGESFDKKKHPPGTEIKAITYSNMQIITNEDGNKTDIFVIVDI